MFKFILSPLPALCCILRQFNSHTVFHKNCFSEILILEATGTAVSQRQETELYIHVEEYVCQLSASVRKMFALSR